MNALSPPPAPGRDAAALAALERDFVAVDALLDSIEQTLLESGGVNPRATSTARARIAAMRALLLDALAPVEPLILAAIDAVETAEPPPF